MDADYGGFGRREMISGRKRHAQIGDWEGGNRTTPRYCSVCPAEWQVTAYRYVGRRGFCELHEKEAFEAAARENVYKSSGTGSPAFMRHQRSSRVYLDRVERRIR